MVNRSKWLQRILLLLILVAVLVPAIVSAEQLADPNGANTGSAIDVPAVNPGQPTQEEMANAVGHNKVSINIMWTLLAGFLVMFMQAGFAMVETGMTRAKNAAHTITMNLLVYPLGLLGFFLTGFAIMFGGVGALGTMGGYPGLSNEFSISLLGHNFGLFGMTGFGLIGTYDVAVFAMFLFQAVFMDTAATIPTGALAERWKFASFCLMGFMVGAVIYPVFGNWVWGGGWLAQLGVNFGLGHGHVDFAGSSVVHMTGGVIGLVGAWLIGPRIGKYNKDGSSNVIVGHSIPMAVIGTFILAFGWFGFNPGSTLAGSDLRIAIVAVNTMLASMTGALAAVAWMWAVRSKKPDPGMACNGMLAGLVAITAPCAFVNQFGALIIGLVAGVLVVESVFFFERKLRIDDPVGAISVHGVNGAWGCLALGLFADGTYGIGWNGVPGAVTGLFYGDPLQFVAEFIGVATNLIAVGLMAFIIYKLISLIVPMRVSPETEIMGLDVPEMGCPGYVGDQPETTSSRSQP
jgi:Amt family ammonium transporter